MKVYLTTTAAENSWHRYDDFEFLQKLRKCSLQKDFVCVDQPDDADLICFVGAQYDDLRDIIKSEVYKNFSCKCTTIQTNDLVIPRLPGAYASVSSRQRKMLGIQPTFYPRVCVEEYEYSFNGDYDYLYSFVGACGTAPVRRKLKKIKDERLYFYDADEHVPGPWMARYANNHKMHFRNIILQSKFVLCPRGNGLSSMRLFETLALGRVPVIISDGFHLPEGPNWESCSIRVPEKGIQNLPRILRGMENEFDSLSGNARAVWDEWYCREKAFETIVKQCAKSRNEWSPSRSKLHCWMLFFDRSYLKQVVIPDALKGLVRIKHTLGIKMSFSKLFR